MADGEQRGIKRAMISTGEVAEFNPKYMRKPVVVIGKYSMYDIENPTVQTWVPSKAGDDFETHVTELAENARDSLNNIYKYPGLEVDVENLYKTLQTKLGEGALLCVGKFADGMLVYHRKTNRRNIPELTCFGVTPEIYKVKATGGPNRTSLVESLQVLCQVITDCFTNVEFKAPTQGDYSFQQLQEIISKMSKEEILTMKGTIDIKPSRARSSFDWAFLNSFSSLMQVRDLHREQDGSLMFNAYNPPVKVCPLDKLVNLNQKGSRLLEVELRDITYTLRDVLANPELMEKYAIVIVGKNATTGFGKTEFAKRLAIEWAIAMNKQSGRPRGDAQILFTSTVDTGNIVDFKPGSVWILDDFDPGDREQNVHMSENMLKVLMSPVAPGDVRARGGGGKGNIELAAGVARVMTANADSSEEWCRGCNTRFSEPIRRKCVSFFIDKPLCATGWARRDDEEEASSTIARDHMDQRMQVVPADPEPPARAGGFLGLFGM